MTLSKRKVIVGLALIVVLAVIIIAAASRKGGNATTVDTESASRRDIVETVTATGRIEPRTQVKISADVAAKITYLGVKEGDWVEKGDLLVRLDQERYVAALEQMEANWRSAKANADLANESYLKAEKDYDRIQMLIEQGHETQASYDQAYANVQIEKARYQSALEMVDQAHASVKQAKDNLSKTTIYAPMAGTISALNKEVGEIALGSQFQEDVIMIVSDLTQMEALVKVDENDIVNVSLGDSATIEIDALPDDLFHGVVREIASSASVSMSGTTEQKTEFEVKLAILDAAEALRPGMTASSDIVIETRDSTLCVPIQCVTVRTLEQLERSTSPPGGAAADSTAGDPEYTADKDGFVSIVWVVQEGVVKATQVKTGIQSDTHIEIVEGISEGDDVVTGSYRAISQTLRNNMHVAVEKSEKKE